MGTFLKRDQYDREIHDVTEDLRNMNLLVLAGNIVRAERRGNNIIVLQNRAGGHWFITYWWTENARSPLTDVVGAQVLRFARNEIDPNGCLFGQVQLF